MTSSEVTRHSSSIVAFTFPALFPQTAPERATLFIHLDEAVTRLCAVNCHYLPCSQYTSPCC
ncbi:hypothetical protein KCP78_09120 [Salmonella enterica subsp. enterica]|nr:hypothetical protein KCP78_09120 [Salmonella enterica subsp. enterica]